MENNLKLLYAIQQIDSQLKEVHELKGDLPALVADLQAKVDTLSAKVKELNSAVKKAKIDRDSADVEIIDLAEKAEKYKEQQLQVKSNKQYDALTREIESAEERSKKLVKEMEVLEGKMQLAKTDSEALSGQLEELTVELKEKEKELKLVNKEHEQEESKLRHDREKLLVRIPKEAYERYDRIKNAKDGVAIVLVKRDACGGCYSRVPPQKLLELRQTERFFMCEHCGRILVSEHVTEKNPIVL